jgi:hypothetical protein
VPDTEGWLPSACQRSTSGWSRRTWAPHVPDRCLGHGELASDRLVSLIDAVLHGGEVRQAILRPAVTVGPRHQEHGARTGRPNVNDERASRRIHLLPAEAAERRDLALLLEDHVIPPRRSEALHRRRIGGMIGEGCAACRQHAGLDLAPGGPSQLRERAGQVIGIRVAVADEQDTRARRGPRARTAHDLPAGPSDRDERADRDDASDGKHRADENGSAKASPHQPSLLGRPGPVKIPNGTNRRPPVVDDCRLRPVQ